MAPEGHPHTERCDLGTCIRCNRAAGKAMEPKKKNAMATNRAFNAWIEAQNLRWSDTEDKRGLWRAWNTLRRHKVPAKVVGEALLEAWEAGVSYGVTDSR